MTEYKILHTGTPKRWRVYRKLKGRAWCPFASFKTKKKAEAHVFNCEKGD